MAPAFVDSAHEGLLGWVGTVLGALQTNTQVQGPTLTAPNLTFYTPKVVRGAPTLEALKNAQAQAIPVVYFYCEGADEHETDETTGPVRMDMDFEIFCFRSSSVERKYPGGSTDGGEGGFPPFDPFANFSGPHPDTVRSRMIKDVKRALKSDPAFNAAGLASGQTVWEIQIAHENRKFYADGWDACHLPCLFHYRHARLDP